ncbi:tail fiber domain-containing protein [Janthinobacterium sp. NKUCC08_JDC]|uniref:tail fiber domain-containing protein n=1 Tax=Janthinobacterium sp. NKUCC08_JDC TaxID=2842122 RepID=UPI001C5A6D94|nr:tail fiber domain-containing protein [Janthinobacterium sp. NKUCC08_JDC]MBW3496986.1 tail fiber domain-containing protein [Janthinobacterium sp. NKUCC08_JDC]
MTDYFYDGMLNVNERLNLLYIAFAAGPYNALPLTGGNMTGPLTSSSRISMASRSPSGYLVIYTNVGWYRIARLTAAYSGEATLKVSGTSPYSNAVTTTILLRRDNDAQIRGTFHTTGVTAAGSITAVKIGTDGTVYVLCQNYSALSVYCDSSMENNALIEYLGSGVVPPATAIDATPVWCLKIGGADVLTVTQTDVVARARLLPGVDNTYDIGQASTAYRTVYARTGTINTSDARLKCDFRDLTAAEISAAKDIARAIGAYRWRDAVDCKGDDAREHVGPTVQAAIEIMQAHGLDPFNYGFICHDTWEQQTIEHPAFEAQPAIPATEAAPEVRNSFGDVIKPAVLASEGFPAVEARAAYTEVTQEAGDRYAFRYDELAMFIAAGQEARLALLEAV